MVHKIIDRSNCVKYGPTLYSRFIGSPSVASLSNEETDPEETNYITEAVAAHFHLVLFLTKLSFCCRFFLILLIV